MKLVVLALLLSAVIQLTKKEEQRAIDQAAELIHSDERAPEWVLQDGAYRQFLVDLQAAVRTNDRKAVIRLTRLPLRVNGPSRSVRHYRTRQAIEKDYERIFTPRVRNAIAQQRFEELFGRDQGVMIGDGEIWFDHSCVDDRCTRRGPVRIEVVNHWPL